jgi:Fe-S cluster biogenesis protein NfuA
MTVVADPQDHRALRALIESVLAPLVAKDGGRLQWVRRVDGVVEVSLGGACLGCPAQRDTADAVLLPAMRAVDPTVSSVRVVPRVVP